LLKKYTTLKQQLRSASIGVAGKSLATLSLLALAGAANAVPSWSMDMAYETRTGNDRVFVANPDQDTVSVMDAVTGNRLAEIAVGDDPRSVALDGLGNLWVKPYCAS